MNDRIVHKTSGGGGPFHCPLHPEIQSLPKPGQDLLVSEPVLLPDGFLGLFRASYVFYSLKGTVQEPAINRRGKNQKAEQNKDQEMSHKKKSSFALQNRIGGPKNVDFIEFAGIDLFITGWN